MLTWRNWQPRVFEGHNCGGSSPPVSTIVTYPKWQRKLPQNECVVGSNPTVATDLLGFTYNWEYTAFALQGEVFDSLKVHNVTIAERLGI